MQVCVSKCPNDYFVFNGNEDDRYKLICDYDADPNELASTLVEKGKCAKYYLKSSSRKY